MGVLGFLCASNGELQQCLNPLFLLNVQLKRDLRSHLICPSWLNHKAKTVERHFAGPLNKRHTQKPAMEDVPRMAQVTAGHSPPHPPPLVLFRLVQAGFLLLVGCKVKATLVELTLFLAT